MTEHELTKLTEMVVAIRDHLDITTAVDAEIEETVNDVAPEAVLDALSKVERRTS